jgi:lysophospholipase L1-like esterase
MAKSRIRPDIVVGSILAALFAICGATMWILVSSDPPLRVDAMDIFVRPWLRLLAILALVDAALILLLVPISRRPDGWTKIALWSAVLLSTFIIAELGAFVLVKQLFHVQHTGSRYTNGFIYSPSLGFVPKPEFRFPLATGDITHTGDGYRGPEPPAKSGRDQKSFLLIGGSSTYDIGLPDNETWSTSLAKIFSDQIRVFNLGIPGHSTAEHITLVSLSAQKYQPEVIIYYIGWNDIRSSHVGESRDYTRFHKRGMLHNFAITEPTSFFALSYVFKKIIALLDETSLHHLSNVDIPGAPREKVDTKLLDMYVHNVRMLAAITRAIGAMPVFVPQVLNDHRFTSDEPYGWIPRIPQRAVPRVMSVFNKAMMEAAHEAGAVTIPEVLELEWQDSDFVDRGHFSQRGAQRFACALAAGLLDRRVIMAAGTTSATFAASCDQLEGASALSARGQAVPTPTGRIPAENSLAVGTHGEIPPPASTPALVNGL